MSVAGWKKKKQTVWILLGAGPFMVCALLLLFLQVHLKRELKFYKQKAEQKTYSTAYCLKYEKKAGEIIQESDLEPVTLSTEADGKLPSFRLRDLTGKAAKVDMKKGSIVSGVLLTKEENAGADRRVCTYSEIEYSTDIQKGSYADIRISFPNGEDYIVARHKELLAVSEEGRELTFCLGEAELLRLSSAFVDSRQYEDTRIYAVAYRDNLQQASLITYPVNLQVYELTGWDPNVLENDGVDSIENVRKNEMQLREQLEKNLEDYRREESTQWEAEEKEKENRKQKDQVQADMEESESERNEFFP